jgi:hypothetical protein
MHPVDHFTIAFIGDAEELLPSPCSDGRLRRRAGSAIRVCSPVQIFEIGFAATDSRALCTATTLGRLCDLYGLATKGKSDSEHSRSYA